MFCIFSPVCAVVKHAPVLVCDLLANSIKYLSQKYYTLGALKSLTLTIASVSSEIQNLKNFAF